MAQSDVRTLWKLMWAINIIGPDCDEWELEATSVCTDHHLRCRFACRIWVCRCENAGFAEICCPCWNIAIHFVCRDVYEAIDAVLPCSFQQNMCSVYIRIRKLV